MGEIYMALFQLFWGGRSKVMKEEGRKEETEKNFVLGREETCSTLLAVYADDTRTIKAS